MCIENILKKVYDKVHLYKPSKEDEEEKYFKFIKNSNVDNEANNKKEIGAEFNFEDTNNNNNNNSKVNFYKNQVGERDSKVEELKSALEVLEMKIKKSEEEKLMLNSKLKEYSDKISQYGLY